MVLITNKTKHLTHKYFVMYFFSAISFFFASAASYNLYYDPLMVSSLTHTSNRIVPVVDARMQKTNKLVHYQAEYDALLIGSSRVEQLRQEDFAPLKVFNYGLPSIYPDEYVDYIDLFLKKNKKELPIIFLGFDFYGSNGNNYDHAKPSEHYIEMCTSLVSVPKFLFNRDTFKYARKMTSSKKEIFTYDRKSLDKITAHITPEESRHLLQKQLEHYKFTYGNYVYNKNFKATLNDIKQHSKGARLVVFTTPESNDLFRIMVQNGLMDNYEQWLTDIVATFGGVYNFMKPGLFASDHKNFIDAHHLFPEKSTPIARLISGKKTNINEEFIGNFVTNKNLKQQLAQIRRDTDNLLKR